MRGNGHNNWVTLDIDRPIWNRFFTVAPLVVIGTKEGERYDLAPKHMVTPLGQDNYFGFVCTPGHATYHNVRREKAFTVSFITPSQIVMASLAATPRTNKGQEDKPIVNGLPTIRAQKVDGLLLSEAYLLLECSLDRIVDGFGDYSLIAGKVEAARISPQALRTSEADEGQMIKDNPMLAYLAYGRFAEIGETKAFPFPRGFEQKVLVKG